MCGRLNVGALLCAVAMFTLLPGAARAQQLGTTTTAAPPPPPDGGNGIKVGEGRIHPYFDLELRFDSAAIARNTGVVPELVTHLRPGLRLEVPGNVLALTLAGDADYVWYSGLLSPGSSNASRLEGAVDLDAQFNRDGPVEFRVRDHFNRSDRTTNPALAVGVVSLYNQVQAQLPIHPGGHALEVAPGASYTVEFFDPLLGNDTGCTGPACNPSAFNYGNLDVSLDGRYKFLPKTALVLDADFQLPQYTSGGAQLLTAMAGLSGLISTKVAVVAKVGWGYNFLTSTAQASTVIGHLEVAYLPSETASVRVGYLRNLQPVAIYSIYGDDRGYVEARALFGGKLTLRGYAAFDLLSFYGTGGGADSNVTVDVGPEYQFKPWLIGGAGYVLTVRTSARANQLNFARNEGYARLTLTY